MPNSMRQMIERLLAQNPNLQGNPLASGLLDAVRSNDHSKGQAMARNICEQMGTSEREALEMAKKFFRIS